MTATLGWVQALIDTGARSSAKAHLTGPASARGNLDILLYTKVSRVLPTNITEEGIKSFRGVEVLDATDGEDQSPLFFFIYSL